MSAAAREPVSSKVFLTLFFAAYFFVTIWDDTLSGNDEPRVAGIAREMALNGEYEHPQLNGEPFLEYPSLGYIPYALAFSLFDRPGDMLAHIVPALFGLGTLFFTYLMGVLLGGRALGIAAALALSTTFGFTHLMAKVLVDPILVFFIAMSLWGYLSMTRAKPGRLPWGMFAFYAGMACGLLTKGLIGTAVPGAVAAVDFAWRRDGKNWKSLRPFWGIVVFLLVLGIWAFEIVNEYGWQVLGEFGRQSVWRFASSSADHAKPVYGYLVPLSYILLPWSALFFVMLWLRWGNAKWREGITLRGNETFPAIWFLTVLAALSLASAKRHVYLAPLFPAFALLAGIWWLRLQERWNVSTRQIAVGLLVSLAGTFGVKQFVMMPRERLESWRPPMMDLVVESSEEEILFYRPSESMRGAAVFYLGRTVPVVETIEDLRRLLLVRPGTARVVTLHDGVADVRQALAPEEILGSKEWKIGRRDFAIFRVSREVKRGG